MVSEPSQADHGVLSLAALPHLQSLTLTDALAANKSPASAMQRLSKRMASNCAEAVFDMCEFVNI